MSLMAKGDRFDGDEAAQTAQQIARVLAEADQPDDPAAEAPAEVDPRPDRTRMFTHTNFSRARMSWDPADREVMDQIRRETDAVMLELFTDAYAILERLRNAVRVPSQILPGWELDELGRPKEDWSRLSDPDREKFGHEIFTRLFEWEQIAAAFWSEAMFAKAIWEERFASGYVVAPNVEGGPRGKLTIDDRTQLARGASVQERYRAIYQSSLSRRCDALVRSMTRIEERLRDRARR